ncbi:MAG: hypothetical protein A3F17_04125 [Gammaproteobacteria bacterium RIFCSPHIGHO2_12_FULL_41_15]|nr:MAG: hypothetical protein A3F17_04125 [Gammaproteobacteria bacterium RIFCSPHIGHO2_12_FULL_41_15]
MRYLLYIFWFFLIVIGVSFSALNAESVHLDYYIGDTNIFLPLLLIITVLIGIALGSILLSRSVVALRYKNHKLRMRLKTAEIELENLRTIPLQDNR